MASKHALRSGLQERERGAAAAVRGGGGGGGGGVRLQGRKVPERWANL